jgi:hypothetical protein
MRGLLALMCWVQTSLAAEDASSVLLLHPAHSWRGLRAALIRVRGELVADGFEVTIQQTEPGVTSASAMATAGQDATSTSIGLFLSSDGKGAEIWIVDNVAGKTIVRHIDTESKTADDASDLLAVRVVELLRATLLESAIARQHEDEAPKPEAPASNEGRATLRGRRSVDGAPAKQLGLHLGGTMLWSPTELGPAWLPVVRAEWLAHRILHPRLSFVGLGTRPQVAGREGNAAVQQMLASFEVALIPWPAWIIRPQLSLGTGVWRVTVDGRADWPYEGVSYGQWAFAADAGMGVTVPLTAAVEIVGEGHSTLAIPPPVVRFAGRDVTLIGRPAVTASIALKVSL